MNRCVFELHIAQTLNVPVELRPFISKDDERDGKLEKDACVSRLGTAVDCASAYVSMKSDRRSIHEAITRDSANGFDTVNQAVEMIRLEYLLNYPIANIMGGKKWTDDKEFFYGGTLILILLFLFLLILVFWWLAVDSMHFASGGILGIHSYLPIIGVLVLFVLRLFTTELELATFIMAFVFGIILVVLWHILAYLAKSCFFWIGLIIFIGFLTTYTVPNRIQLLLDHGSRENRKEAAASLSKAVETLYPRALGDANGRIMISFDNFRESNVFRHILCNCFPLLMYRRWSTMIMRQKKRNNRNNREVVKSSTIPAAPGIDNNNETTPLVIV